MADLEEFLIAEFNEQHNNMRQIETSMTQMVQGFFTIEGIVLAGTLTILSQKLDWDQIIMILVPIFWFLSLFGHITYIIAIHSFASIVTIDFQNVIIRRYFGSTFGHEEYLYFMLNPEAETGGKPFEWEKVRDPRADTAKFVGVANTLNITAAIVTSIYTILTITTQQPNLLATLSKNTFLVLAIFIILGIVVHQIYYRIFFLRIVRKEEQVTLERRHNIIDRIKQKSKSVEQTPSQQVITE